MSALQIYNHDTKNKCVEVNEYKQYTGSFMQPIIFAPSLSAPKESVLIGISASYFGEVLDHFTAFFLLNHKKRTEIWCILYVES